MMMMIMIMMTMVSIKTIRLITNIRALSLYVPAYLGGENVSIKAPKMNCEDQTPISSMYCPFVES